MFGTGFFPTERSNIYALEADDLYLTGTSEVALAGLHMGEILEADELPLATAAFSTCFRREAGAAGKDTRGHVPRPPVQQGRDVRLHRGRRSPRRSTSGWSRWRRSSCRQLGLPYRAVNVAAGDLGAPAAKKIDLEAWFPSQGRYREVTSCSNTTDFQARTARDPLALAEHGLEPPHTLNGTVVTDRAVLAILENFQGDVPDVLQKYGAPSLIGG